MQSPIRNLSLIQRNPGSQRIDIKSTLQVIAKELIVWSEEEKRIRTSRRYKRAIRRVFQRDGLKRAPKAYLVAAVLRDLKIKYEDYKRIRSELEQHIDFNRRTGGYLVIKPGFAGGVELLKP